jgi:hypothetical protein
VGEIPHSNGCEVDSAANGCGRGAKLDDLHSEIVEFGEGDCGSDSCYAAAEDDNFGDWHDLESIVDFGFGFELGFCIVVVMADLYPFLWLLLKN